MDVNNLIGVKLALLLHDPPSKMWTPRIRKKHEEVAEEFAENVLRDTRLMDLYKEAKNKYWGQVKSADIIASSFDRWILLRGSRRKYNVHYDYLHNIFNPLVKTELKAPSDIQDSMKTVSETLNTWLKESQNILEKHAINPYTPLYNVLYATLELAWYALGLHPSLADTRTPTHTIFDHLYASASVVNIIDGGEIKGYYVIIDYPEIQRFVLSGRKAGDFWAASWLLSNLVWGVGLKLAGRYGLDVILTPSPRLNPYTFKYVASILSGRDNPYIAVCPERSDENSLLSSICEHVRAVYGLKSVGDLNVMMSQPLVPATMTMLLPSSSAKNSRELAENVHREYVNVWKEILEAVRNSLAVYPSKPLQAYLVKYLSEGNLELFETPPTGLRVTVVDVASVYESLKECIERNKEESCRRVLLEPRREELERLIKEWGSRDLYSEVARKLLYHLLTTRGLALAGIHGYIITPIPRSFYYEEGHGGGLSYVVEYDIPCSICGDEPALLKFSKVFRDGWRLDYGDDTRRDIEEKIGMKLDETSLREFAKIFKPGEAIGPYCLLKRAVYIAFRSRTAVYYSTDDVALMQVSSFANEDKYKNSFNRVIEVAASKLGEKLGTTPTMKEVIERKILEIYDYKLNPVDYVKSIGTKDLEDASAELGVSYERFIGDLRNAISESCTEVFNKEVSKVPELLKDVAEKLFKLKLAERGDEFLELVLKVTSADPRRALETVCNAIVPSTSYAVVKASADNIGRILSGAWVERGKLPEYLREYAEAILNSIFEKAKVTPKRSRDEVNNALRRAYAIMGELMTSLGLEEVPVTPALHASVSLSLVLSAVEDYRVSREMNGMIVYSGGDDLLAFYPVQTALSASREHRLRFTEGGFKRVFNPRSQPLACEIPVASSLMTGRSVSVRFVNIKDVMSEEVSISHELMEEYAKNSKWIMKIDVHDEKTSKEVVEMVEKDSIVVSDSRASIITVLPNRLTQDVLLEYATSIYSHIDKLSLALLANIVSRGLPEDLRNYLGDMQEALRAGFGSILDYVLGRNVKIGEQLRRDKESLIRSLLDELHVVKGRIRDRDVDLAMNYFANLLSILRRYVG